MNTPRIVRTALIASLALGLGTAAPAWADGHYGHEDHDGFGPAAAIVGLAAAVIAAPYVFGSARVVAPPPVYAPPPVAYAPPVVYAPPAYAYSPPPAYVVAPAPRYYGHYDRYDHERRDRGWHRGWRRGDDD